jgi:hypothetical protein
MSAVPPLQIGDRVTYYDLSLRHKHGVIVALLNPDTLTVRWSNNAYVTTERWENIVRISS